METLYTIFSIYEETKMVPLEVATTAVGCWRLHTVETAPNEQEEGMRKGRWKKKEGSDKGNRKGREIGKGREREGWKKG